jgi:hypothetical protein
VVIVKHYFRYTLWTIWSSPYFKIHEVRVTQQDDCYVQEYRSNINNLRFIRILIIKEYLKLNDWNIFLVSHGKKQTTVWDRVAEHRVNGSANWNRGLAEAWEKRAWLRSCSKGHRFARRGLETAGICHQWSISSSSWRWTGRIALLQRWMMKWMEVVFQFFDAQISQENGEDIKN